MHFHQYRIELRSKIRQEYILQYSPEASDVILIEIPGFYIDMTRVFYWMHYE